MRKARTFTSAQAVFVLAAALILLCAVYQRRAATIAFHDFDRVDQALRTRVALHDLAARLERTRAGAAADDTVARANALSALLAKDAEQDASRALLVSELPAALKGDEAARTAALERIAQIERTEERLLAERHERATQSATHAGALQGWGFLLAAMLALVGLVVRQRGRRERDRAIALLAKSEQMHRMIMESASDIITLRDMTGRFLHSHNLERFTGWSQDDFATMSTNEIIHPDDRPLLMDLTREVLDGRSGEPTRFRLRCKDGSWRWFESTSAVVRDAFDTPSALRSSTRDVTEDVERDRALRRSEELCRTALVNVPNASILLVNHELRCMKASGSPLQKQLGAIDDAEGRLLREFIVPADLPKIEALFRKALRGELSMDEVTRAGRELALRAVPVYDENGTVVAAMAIASDVTEHRCETRKLERVTARLNALIGHLQEGVLFEDVDRGTRRANRALAVMQRMTVEELEAMDRPERLVYVARTYADPKAFVRATLAHLEAAVPVVDEPLRTADGRLIKRDYVPVHVNGAHVGNLWCLSDVTERETRERRLRQQAEELHAHATRDELTGLANRRGLAASAGELLGQAARERRMAALFFADLNGMKAINDSLGHASGDEALIEAGRILTSVFGAEAIIARLGGDEFVVLCTARDREDADRIGRAVVESVAAFNARRVRGFRLSMSFGTVVAEAPFPSLDALLSEADALMYEQKRERRGRSLSLPPVRSSLLLRAVR